MNDTWEVKKSGPSLAIEARVAELLGSEFVVKDFDPTQALAQQVADARVLLIRNTPVSQEVIDAAPRLCLIQRLGVQVEGVDIEYAAAKGIAVCNVPGTLTHGASNIAEHVMFLALALAKRYRELLTSIEGRRIGGLGTYVLRDKVLGLVGVGQTGRGVIPLARAFGMEVCAVKRRVTGRMREGLQLDWLETMDRLPDLLGQSDFVSLHVPLNRDTEGLIGAAELALMKPSAYLINVARGRIVDQTALRQALEEGRLAGAGLDAFWDEPPDPHDPLLVMPNVIATPHVGGTSVEDVEIVAEVTADNIHRVRAGSLPLYPVGGKH